MQCERVMKIAIGCDHGGFHLKTVVVRELETLGHIVLDCGTATLVPDDDYPDFTQAVGQALQRGAAERGIVICGSGVGASIAANKMHGIRAALCHDTFSAHQGVEDDNMNDRSANERALPSTRQLRRACWKRYCQTSIRYS